MATSPAVSSARDSSRSRNAIVGHLALVGALSTIPLAIEVLEKRSTFPE